MNAVFKRGDLVILNQSEFKPDRNATYGTIYLLITNNQGVWLIAHPSMLKSVFFWGVSEPIIEVINGAHKVRRDDPKWKDLVEAYLSTLKTAFVKVGSI